MTTTTKNFTVKLFNERNLQTTSKSFYKFEKALSTYNELKTIAKNTGNTFTICLYSLYNNQECLIETDTVNPTRIIKF